jgi:hypothetical protein
MPDETDLTRVQGWRRIGGGVILAIVALTYLKALSRGEWPRNHPWWGICTTLLAIWQFFPLRPRWPQIVLLIGFAIAFAFWTVSIWK